MVVAVVAVVAVVDWRGRPFRRAVLDHSFNAETTRHVGGEARLYGQPEIFHEARPRFIRGWRTGTISPSRAIMRSFSHSLSLSLSLSLPPSFFLFIRHAKARRV